MRLVVGIALLFWACVASAQEEVAIRFVNGMPVKGDLVSVKPDGLEIASEGANKFYPWSAFSVGTRFRYEQRYRDNLATAQRGRPVEEWTNSLSEAAAMAPMSFNALSSVADRPRARLPGFSVADGANAVSWGFRYGPKDTDVAYAVLEGAGSEDLPSSLLLWTGPSASVERLSGSRRASGSDAVMIFRNQRFSSVREGVNVQCDLAFAVSGREPDMLNVALDVELKKGGASSSFALYGVPPGFIVGEGAIAARDLLVPPTMTWMVRRGGLSGDIRMDRLQLFPRAGMDTAVSVSIADAEGRVLLEEKVQFREGRQDGAPALELSLKRLPSGQTYTLRARADLGLFLGVLNYEQTFVAP